MHVGYCNNAIPIVRDPIAPTRTRFYAEGTLGGVTFKGTGECHSRRDWPEKGLVVSRFQTGSEPEKLCGKFGFGEMKLFLKQHFPL